MNTHDCRETALLALELGLSPVPPAVDGSKRPLADIKAEDGGSTWKPYSDTPATRDHVLSWYSGNRTGVGLACGYGGLTCFEFDSRDVYEDFLDIAGDAGVDDIVNRVRGGYEEFTPSGGVHWLYRTPDPRGSTKLAERPHPTDANKRDPLIETRGQGGFIIVAPSHGTVHPTGKPYTLVLGGLPTITTLSKDEEESLWSVARSFNEMPKTERVANGTPTTNGHGNGGSRTEDGSTRPGDDFNDRASWEAILEPHGWVKIFARNGGAYWRRPGKDRGISATTGYTQGMKIFSTSTSLPTEGTSSKLHVYATLAHGGDVRSAIKDLIQKGYGTWIDNRGEVKQNPPARQTLRGAVAPNGHAAVGELAVAPDCCNGDGYRADPDDSKLAWLPHTDTGAAERMVARFGSSLRYCHPWKKWLYYDGRRWAIDDTAAVRRMGKATARKILAEASTVDDKEAVQKLIAFARSRENKNGLTAMIDLASVEEGIPVLHPELDTHAWLLNVENGTIDLETGKLRPHSRRDLITALAPVTFDPDAKCPLWDATLERFFAGNQGLIAFWDHLCGIALTGDVSEQILPILHGVGDNGKSTMVGVMLAMLGKDYAAVSPPNLLLARRAETHPTERAFLFGKRLVANIETPEDARLNEALIKSLTGGDQITARRMHEDNWSFEPTHKIWLATNHQPEVRGTDHAIWRRLKMVPFGVKIAEEDKITDFPTQLRDEYPGILARCVRGCLDWQKNGLGVPQAVKDATENYRSEQDILEVFIVDECIIHTDCRAKASAMYERYRSKTEHFGSETLSLTRFGQEITKKGFDKKQNNGIWYLGIGLRSSAPTKPNNGSY